MRLGWALLLGILAGAAVAWWFSRDTPSQVQAKQARAQQAAAAAGAAAPMGAQAEGLYALFDRLGYGTKDFSGIVQMLRGRLDELA